jgi:hypothetical protein
LFEESGGASLRPPQFTRECLLLLVDSSLTGQKGGLGTVAVIAARGTPVSITVDKY